MTDDSTQTKPAVEKVTEADLDWARALFDDYERQLGKPDTEEDPDQDR